MPASTKPRPRKAVRHAKRAAHLLLRGVKKAVGKKTEAAPPAHFSDWLDMQHDAHAGFRQMTFTFALIALAAKLAQCDGPVTEEEFKSFCILFPMPHEEHVKLDRLFAMACTDSATSTHYVRQITQLFPNQQSLMRDVALRLCRLAASDGPINAAERRFLLDVTKRLGVPESAISQAVGDGKTTYVADPYTLLGIPRGASDEAIKSAYRACIREAHPDRVMAAGGSARLIALAEARMREITNAYQAIFRKRGLR